MTAAVGPRSKRAQTPQPVRAQPPPLPATVPVSTLLPSQHDQAVALAHAAKGFEALGCLVQYLVFRVSNECLCFIIDLHGVIGTTYIYLH